MSHWHDEIGKTSYYVEQVILGNEEFEQKRFVEAIKILQGALSVFHDYAHECGRLCKNVSDNPDHSCMGKWVSGRARSIYNQAKKFNEGVEDKINEQKTTP